jgi:hypothetical protein
MVEYANVWIQETSEDQHGAPRSRHPQYSEASAGNWVTGTRSWETGEARHVEGAGKGRLPQARGGAKQESPCAPCAQTALATANEITCQIEGSTMGQYTSNA